MIKALVPFSGSIRRLKLRSDTYDQCRFPAFRFTNLQHLDFGEVSNYRVERILDMIPKPCMAALTITFDADFNDARDIVCASLVHATIHTGVYASHRPFVLVL